MTGIPTPEAVEAMTHRLHGLLDRAQQAQALHHTWINVRVDDLAALLARALPLPHRYTGGPLEDGVYLYRRPTWHPVNWVSFGVADDFANPYVAPRLVAGEWVWLIGPIHIPPIPESEEASS